MKKGIIITLAVVLSYLAICAFMYLYNKDNWGDIEVVSAQEKFSRFINPFFTMQRRKQEENIGI